MDMIKLLDEGFAWTGEQVGKVQPEHLDAATPCTRWDLRALLNHMLGAMEQLAGTAAGDPDPSLLDADELARNDRIGNDPAAAFDAIVRRALAVWHTPGVLERTCTLPFGPRPASVVARISVSDAVVHGWDIARALGENTDIPAELAEPLLEIDRQLVDDGVRARAFAAEVTITGGTASDRLVAFLGRTP
jgi:uncharacterized protein (TIGR03086 family)